MGYDVLEARNGDEALKAFELELIDLMLTDLVMPGKEGLETISALKRKHGGAKIIAMSGGGRGSAKDYLNVAKMLGANRVLLKPFSNDEMEAAINDVLGKAGSV
jgi:DNA-binding response OmpR family regulator